MLYEYNYFWVDPNQESIKNFTFLALRQMFNKAFWLHPCTEVIGVGVLL